MKIAHTIGSKGFRVAVAALALAAGWSAAGLPLKAQDSTSRILNAEETMSCICWEDELALIESDLNGPDLGAKRAEFNRVDELLRQAHANLDTSDKAEVESVQRISERRALLKQEVEAVAFPLQRRRIALVSQYNALCTGRRMLAMNVEAARANPQCPPAP
jgi:hypothetical protein